MSKIRSRGEIPGKRAQLQFPEHQPSFYFYLPEGQTPETFSLIRLEEKGDHRQFEVGSAGGASGSHTSGLKLKSIREFTIERVASRVYRVTPEGELDTGEYGFIGTFTYMTVGLAGSGERIYDFAIARK